MPDIDDLSERIKRLTELERLALLGVAQFKTSKEIQQDLEGSPNVDHALKRACRKLGADSRTAAARLLVQHMRQSRADSDWLGQTLALVEAGAIELDRAVKEERPSAGQPASLSSELHRAHAERGQVDPAGPLHDTRPAPASGSSAAGAGGAAIGGLSRQLPLDADHRPGGGDAGGGRDAGGFLAASQLTQTILFWALGTGAAVILALLIASRILELLQRAAPA